jgi:catechol-2,3-dioxygenase
MSTEEARRADPSQVVSGFAELTLEATDLDAMVGFYETMLGLERLSEDGDRVWLAAGPSARLGLWCPGQKEHGDEGGRHVHFAFAAEAGTLSGLAERLRADGREVEVTEHEGGDCSLYLEDPEGNVIELWDYFDRR